MRRKKDAPKICEAFGGGTTRTIMMAELATDLLARLRRNEIDIPVFIREAEKLPDDEWQILSDLVMQWFSQQKIEGDAP
jgi:hypothetical protein